MKALYSVHCSTLNIDWRWSLETCVDQQDVVTGLFELCGGEREVGVKVMEISVQSMICEKGREGRLKARMTGMERAARQSVRRLRGW